MYQFPHGDTRNLKRVSGSAAFQPQGESGWIELGDVMMHQARRTLGRKATLRARRWGVVQAREDVTTVAVYWLLELQEYIESNLRLLFFGAPGADWEQPQLVGQTVTLAGVARHRSFDLGAMGVTNVQVSVGDWVATAGADYAVDAEAGMLWLPRDSQIRDGETVTVTYSAPAVRMNRLAGLGGNGIAQREGTLRLLEWDGETTSGTSGAVRSMLVLPCTLSVEEEREAQVTAFCSLTLRASPTGPLEYRMRTVAEPTLVAGGTVLMLGSRLRRLGRLRSDAGGRLRIR